MKTSWRWLRWLRWVVRAFFDRCPGCGEPISDQREVRLSGGWYWCGECYVEFGRNPPGRA